jgi:riboflavin biosynthesis pyrimidine reductase
MHPRQGSCRRPGHLYRGRGLVRRQAIEPGLVDEIDLQLNPVILGSGERLFDGFEAGQPTLELARVLEAPGVAHLRYRVVR